MDYPSCVLNENEFQTFDNKTYQAKLGNDWHTVFLYTPKQIESERAQSRGDNEVVYDNKHKNVAVIAKDSSNGKTMEVLLGDYAVEIRPTGASGGRASRSSEGSDSNRSPAAHVSVNGQEVRFSGSHGVEIVSPAGESVVNVFANNNGEVSVFSPKYGLNIKYYGEYAVIYAAPHYKENIRGLCGTYDGDKYTDFTSPKNCILADPQLFAASYALIDSNGSSSIKQKQHEANNAQCYREVYSFVDIISDREAGRRAPRSQAWLRNSNKNNQHNNNNQDSEEYQSNNCENKQNRIVYDNDGNMCISLHAYPKYKNENGNNAYEFQATFFCNDKNDSNMKRYRQLIEKGAHPNLSQKGSNKKFTVKIPKNCAQNQY